VGRQPRWGLENAKNSKKCNLGKEKIIRMGEVVGISRVRAATAEGVGGAEGGDQKGRER